jgi:peptidoglycan/xylan/chitin deacetylase (PgdA/CDA1 family)
VITFDDGYRDFYSEAMGVMKQCGFTATIFLATDRIRHTSTCNEGANYLTWSEVRELHAEGIHFASHTVTHPDLRSLDRNLLDYELGHSKEIIEQNTGAALKNLGFEYGVSTILGRACGKSNRFFLPRLPVNNWDDRLLLQSKLEGGYDWLHLPQLLKKCIFHNTTLMQQAPGTIKRAI